MIFRPENIGIYYDIVPKDLRDNLRFRRRILMDYRDDTLAQGQLWSMCQTDPLFYVNAFCVAAGTPVVTDRGLVPIENVQAGDKVWDGKSWVFQAGALYQGCKSVIFAYNIWMTPDHKVRTDHGWTDASEGYDRQKIRLPDGYSAQWAVPQHDSSRLAMPMLLREGMDCGRGQFAAGLDSQLRMSEGWAGDAWDEQNANISCLEQHEGTMSEPKQHSLSPLRRKRHIGRSSVDGFHGLFGGHGRTAGRIDFGANRQRGELHKIKLPLGNPQGTGKQYKTQCDYPSVPRGPVTQRGGRNGGNNRRGDTLSAKARIDRGRFASTKTLATAAVYDLLNCGPNHAFTVIGFDGCPLLVHNCWTYNPTNLPKIPAPVPFITYPCQDDALADLLKAIGNYNIAVEKSREMGASWVCLTAYEYLWHFYSYYSFLVASRKEMYVDDGDNPDCLFWKLRFALKALPGWLRPMFTYVKLKLTNHDTNSTIDGDSTTGDLARGGRRTSAMLDEAAAIAFNEAAKADRSLHYVTSSLIKNSTPQGADGAYYKTTQNDEIPKITLHWSMHAVKAKGLYKVLDNGEVEVLDQKWHDENPGYDFSTVPGGYKGLRSPWYDFKCKQADSDAEIAQELDMDYLGSGHTFFSVDALEKHKETFCAKPVGTFDLEYDQNSCEPVAFRDVRNGPWRLWLRPNARGMIDTKREYVMGVDVAMGTGNSNSAISVADRESGEKVAQYMFSHIPPEAFARLVVAAARMFNSAFVVWEMNGPGQLLSRKIPKELGYRNFYRRQKETNLRNKRQNEPGWCATNDSKRILLSNYREALTSNFFVNRDQDAVMECRRFVVTGEAIEHVGALNTEDPNAARHNHGDIVIADALCYMAVTARRIDRANKKQTAPPNSYAGRLERYKQRQKQRNESWFAGVEA